MTIRQRQGIRRQLSSTQQTAKSGLEWLALIALALAIGGGLAYAF